MNSNLFTAALVVEHKARETASPEEATVSTSQDITSVKIERTKGMRKPRSASADRLLETDAPHPQVSSLSMLASPGGHSGPWTSWGHERRRQWRRSLSGSQSLSHVGYTPLNVHRWLHTGSSRSPVAKELLISLKIWVQMSFWAYLGLTRYGPFDKICLPSFWMTS